MDFRILILDDNHSFIDLVKMKLDKYPFRFDISFRHDQATQLIKKHRAFFSGNLIDVIEDATNRLTQWIEEGEKEPYPKLDKTLMKIDHIFQPEGYLLIIVEDRVERLSKGVEFIQNIMSVDPHFQSNDFILFVNNQKALQVARQNTIPAFLKDIRNEAIYQFVDLKVKEVKGKIEILERAFNKFSDHRAILQSKLSKKTNTKKKTKPVSSKKSTK